MAYDDPKMVCIPVRMVNGEITYFYSGLPFSLKYGALGDLIVTEFDVGERLRSILQRESKVVMFAAETVLWVNVNLDPVYGMPEHLRDLLLRHTEAKPLATGWFAPVYLRTPLHLLLRGTKLGELSSCTIIAPWNGKLDDPTSDVQSLNEAYTRISQLCEPQRRSHTGNVFEKVHYLNDQQRLRPISERREQLEAVAEYAIAVLSGSWWLKGASGLPHYWAHLGQNGEHEWIVSVVDAKSFVNGQESLKSEVEAVAFLLGEGFHRLPFEPLYRNDWPPEPPYWRQQEEEITFPWRWALEHTEQR